MQVACVVKFVNRVVLLAPVFSLYLCLDVFGACIACVCMCGRVCTRVYACVRMYMQCFNKIDCVSMEEVDRLARQPNSVVTW